jgi:hypothetical protein
MPACCRPVPQQQACPATWAGGLPAAPSWLAAAGLKGLSPPPAFPDSGRRQLKFNNAHMLWDYLQVIGKV